MGEPGFHPGGFYEFDLEKGHVRTRGGARVLVLSDAALAALIDSAVQSKDLTAVRRLGRDLGEELGASLESDGTDVPAERSLGHAAALLGLFGWGRLGLERWGDTLVARLDGMPTIDRDQLGVATLLGGLFSGIVKRDVACVPVAGTPGFVVVDPSIAAEVWSWAQAGADVPAIAARLAAPEAP